MGTSRRRGECRWWPTVTALRPTTRARDEQFLRSYVLPTFGNTPLARIERTELRRWVATLVAPAEEGGEGKAPATVQKAVQVLNKAMRAAVEDRMIPYNPVADLPLSRIEREEMRFLTADEVWRLADETDPRYRSFVLLAGYGGLRLGEIPGRPPLHRERPWIGRLRAAGHGEPTALHRAARAG